MLSIKKYIGDLFENNKVANGRLDTKYPRLMILHDTKVKMVELNIEFSIFGSHFDNNYLNFILLAVILAAIVDSISFPKVPR